MSLSQKKSKKKQKNLRNVLMRSEKEFWPVVSENQALEINDLLKQCLPAVKIDVPRVPFSKLRSVPKEERRKKQMDLLSKQSSEVISAYNKARELRKFLFIGVNSVCNGIEKKRVASCVLDAEVSPKILVVHVAELAKNASVPVLAIHNMKETTRSVLGFSTLALGFNKSVKEDQTNTFHKTCTRIEDMAKLLEKCETSVEELSKPNANGEDSDMSEECGIDEEEEKESSNVLESDSVKKTNVNTSTTSMEDIIQSIYLYRDSENVRIFRPPTTLRSELQVSPQLSDKIKLASDTEMISEDDVTVDVVDFKDQRYYKPPIVKRVQGNPAKRKNQNKKKIKKK